MLFNCRVVLRFWDSLGYTHVCERARLSLWNYRPRHWACVPARNSKVYWLSGFDRYVIRVRMHLNNFGRSNGGGSQSKIIQSIILLKLCRTCPVDFTFSGQDCLRPETRTVFWSKQSRNITGQWPKFTSQPIIKCHCINFDPGNPYRAFLSAQEIPDRQTI